MNKEELQNRVAQLEEEVFSKQDNNKKDEKIGHLQTRVRDLKQKSEDLESIQQEHELVIDRITAEEDVHEEVKSLKTKIERLTEREKENIKDISNESVSEIEKLKQDVEKLEDNIERAIDSYDELLTRFEDQTSEVHQEIAVATEKADVSLNLQVFSLIHSYVPEKYQEMIGRRVSECYRLPYQKNSELTAFLSTWVALCNGELEECYEGDPTESPEIFEAYVVERRLDEATEHVWSNVSEYIDDEKENGVEEFMSSEEGQMLEEKIWQILGEPTMEMISQKDSHIISINNGVTDEKREEAIDWFENYYELQDRQEAVTNLVDHYFGGAS